MKFSLRAMVAVSCLIIVALFSRCGGGSTQQTPTLMISPTSAPNGTLEIPYTQTIQASGGAAPFTWAVSAGALPHGLTLSSSLANTVTVSGTPDTVAQAVAFTIKVTDSGGRSATQPYTVSILLEPDTITLAPPSIDYGAHVVGTVAAPQVETVTNTGASAVFFSSITVTGPNAGDFSASTACGSNLAAGANCVISVTFIPGQLGTRSASITIVDNTVGSPHSVSLTGMGLASIPNATLSSTGLVFGEQVIGTTSTEQTITLSNFGTGTLSIASIATSGNFHDTTTCSATLPAASSCNVGVTFTPSRSGKLDGTLLVTDNAHDSPQACSLSGTGVTRLSCTPIGQVCGPSLPQCCPAPFRHHSFCATRGGFGRCVEN